MNIRLMRGQVVVRELDAPPCAVLWTPEQGPRQIHTHRGIVLGLGLPARLTEHPNSPEVPHGFDIGATIQFHFGAAGTQASRTRAWTDGMPAIWLTQAEIDGVWEPSHICIPDEQGRCAAVGYCPACPSGIAGDDGELERQDQLLNLNSADLDA
jgi:hypothetical protein